MLCVYITQISRQSCPTCMHITQRRKITYIYYTILEQIYIKITYIHIMLYDNIYILYYTSIHNTSFKSDVSDTLRPSISSNMSPRLINPELAAAKPGTTCTTRTFIYTYTHIHYNMKREMQRISRSLSLSLSLSLSQGLSSQSMKEVLQCCESLAYIHYNI